MLFMVVEHFGERGTSLEENLRAIGERFRRCGRMLPDGVEYIASWMEAGGARCFQLMNSPDRAGLDEWIARWEEGGSLARFEVVEVQTSAEFWAGR